MKLNKFILTVAAALLPAFAHASEGSDLISDSFERGFQREIVISSASAVVQEADPLADAIRAALSGEPVDQIAASFDRDMNHVPATVMAMLFIEADPLTDAIFVALNSEPSDQIAVGFDRDLNRAVI